MQNYEYLFEHKQILNADQVLGMLQKQVNVEFKSSNQYKINTVIIKNQHLC